jgi:hypothetical protein
MQLLDNLEVLKNKITSHQVDSNSELMLCALEKRQVAPKLDSLPSTFRGELTSWYTTRILPLTSCKKTTTSEVQSTTHMNKHDACGKKNHSRLMY